MRADVWVRGACMGIDWDRGLPSIKRSSVVIRTPVGIEVRLSGPESHLDLQHLLGHDRENLDVDPIELVETGPGPCLGEAVE